MIGLTVDEVSVGLLGARLGDSEFWCSGLRREAKSVLEEG